ncbi:MAG: molybdopterin-dependent oxidoreductase [Gammaproteobacteria bacterium]|nr:molybdopterin-dependent oxidoreductase [Gammaproteobacteria bacterium]
MSDTLPGLRNESRRAFLLGFGAGSLVLAVGGLPLLQAAQEPKRYGGEGMPHGLRDDPQLFIEIAEDGAVNIVCIRSEMGQGVRTSVALVIADELEAEWSRVSVKQAQGDEERYGNQDTDGSRSLRQSFAALRRAGAAARAMLETAAAATWSVDVGSVAARHHEVVHAASGRKLGYGELARRAAGLPVPAAGSLRLKPPAEFRYIGKDRTPLVDGLDIVSGRAQYGIDTRRDGMVYAVIARPPVYGGRLVSFDAAEAGKLPGVIRILTLETPPIPSGFMPLGGVAVIADNTGTAIKARQLLKIQWDDGPNAGYDSTAFRAELEAASKQPGWLVRDQGDVGKALAGANRRLAADYYLPHLAHAPMEPPAAVAELSGTRCEFWACTQGPQAARVQVAEALGLPLENVTGNVTLLGGGFGRKSKPDYVVEAALLSRAMGGKPVKLTWTREDDIVNDYFHTVSAEHLEAGLDADGKVSAWLHRTTAPSIGSTFGPDPLHLRAGELAQGITDLPFAIPNIRIENPEARAHTRIGWFRSVYNIPHAFAIQSFVAELAHAAGRDHRDYLLELLGPPRRIESTALGDTANYGEDPGQHPVDIGRWRRVVETVTREAGWGRKLPPGRGLGLAAHRSFVSYTAVVCEVEVGANGSLSIPRVDIAVDCGPQVNPERVRSQMEGAVIMGLGLALHGEIRFEDGRAQQTNFHQFQVLRINETPREIRVHMIAPDDFAQPLGGVGEPGLPPVAPALVNAVFAASGQRIRALPLSGQIKAAG